MTLINVGDRVEYTGAAMLHLIGLTGTVTELVGNDVCAVHIDGREYGIMTKNLKVVEPAKAGPGGMKYDGGKARMALLFDGCPRALEAVGQVLTFGAEKYAAHSWQSVPEGEERYKSALLRHLLAIGKGEDIDKESGLHHLAHAACNAMFILELELRKRDESLSKSN